jgi:hypothetical protein
LFLKPWDASFSNLKSLWVVNINTHNYNLFFKELRFLYHIGSSMLYINFHFILEVLNFLPDFFNDSLMIQMCII